MKKITILIHCKDQSGIIAAVTNFIASKGGNIVYIDQHVDQEQAVFFMRLEGEFDKTAFNDLDFKVQFQQKIADIFDVTNGALRDNPTHKDKIIFRMDEVEMLLPVSIGDYTELT